MFLKINDGNGGWILFDNVDRINFGQKNISIMKREELDNLSKSDENLINLISKDCFPRNVPLDISTLEFYRSGIKILALFSSYAYVLNEAGDTVETIRSSVKRKN